MKVMVIGNGAREHTLVWKIKQSPKVDELFAAPGNAGTAGIARNLDISATDLEALARAAEDRKIDLTVVGPEAPLAAGIVDLFQKRKLRVFGPTKAAAQIEASKVFSKNIMQKYGIPCAQGEVFSSYSEARDYVKLCKAPMVIKADGLAAGKGVTVAASKDQALEALSDAMEKRTLGEAGRLLEEAERHLTTCIELENTRFVLDAQKEYAEAHATLALTMGLLLPTPEDIKVEYSAYLNGLAEAASELRRYLLDGLRGGDFHRGEELLGAMDDIYSVLVTMDFPDSITGGLRRTTDMLRGVMEKTRSDLTLSVQQNRLEDKLEEFNRKLK